MSTVSKICKVLAIYSKEVHLFADEAMARGDFAKLDRLGVNCSIALQPGIQFEDAVIDPPRDM